MKILKNIKKRNKYTIEFINTDNFEYSKQTLVYTQKEKNDYIELDKELKR